MVRNTLGLPFEGSSYEWTAFLGDVHLKGHHAEGGTEQHSSDRGLAFIVPFDDGSHRIVTIDRNDRGDRDTRELKIEELQGISGCVSSVNHDFSKEFFFPLLEHLE